jgi:ketosteroid isomerase-like protein
MLKQIVRPFLIAGLLAGFTGSVAAKPPTVATLEAWLQRYGAAWETRDAAAAGRLFTADANYFEMPFDAPKKGRAGIEEYWRGVTADQRDIHFEARAISVSGNTGVAHWSAKFRLQSTGATLELDGVFVLEFDASGACSSLREWWHVRVGQ